MQLTTLVIDTRRATIQETLLVLGGATPGVNAKCGKFLAIGVGLAGQIAEIDVSLGERVHASHTTIERRETRGVIRKTALLDREGNEMSDYLMILITAAVGIIAAACGSYLSARWAIRRAFQERWWDRKEQAYREIIDALHDLLRYSSFEAEREREQERTGEPSRDHPKRKEFAAQYSEAYWKVQKMTDIGPFVISENAVQILQKLRDRPKLEWGDCATLELREQETARYREALDGILKCARADLKA